MKKLLIPLLLALAGPVRAEPELVLLVRHAEKAEQPPRDPELSAAGQARALLLAETLADAGLSAILSTDTRRTRATAAPTAQRLGLRAHTLQDLGASLDWLRQQSGRVLVVGHSNTLPELVRGLGGPVLKPLCESRFDQLWLLSPARAGQPARLLRLRYGASSPESFEQDCL